MQYFFILGRNPELSLAELHAVLPEKYTLHNFSGEVAIVECAKLEVTTLMTRLGGTIKIGEIISHTAYPLSPTPLLKILQNVDRIKKLFFGISTYALDTHTHLPSVREIRELGIAVKRGLQEQGYKVRLVTSKEVALSSVIVKREKLLTQGAEIVLLYSSTRSAAPRVPLERDIKSRATSDGEILLGKTLAVQEFQEASARDFGRPERSMGVGMLPIQLTKIMLNLARTPLPATILDPFCGLGTVLMEAAQMGYTRLIGADLEQTMINATRQNLEWLTKHRPFSVSGETENVKLIATPVEELSGHLPPSSVDAIVTEPYLGPTREHAELKTLISQLSTLYIAAFCEFAKILKPGGRVVFIFPAFRRGTALTKTSDAVLPKIKTLGFTPRELIPTNPLTHLPAYPRTSITYSRPDQRVLREIFVLELKK